jgi:uncharacterized protein (UPF0276 family)
MIDVPYLGHGVGLRSQHYPTILSGPPELARVDWFEAISENFMVPGGNPRHVLEKVRERSPVVLHGVSLSIGGVDPLDTRYLDELAALVRATEPAWISDHLSWGSFGGRFVHDLLPLPYTEEALAHVAGRVRAVQDRLKRQILVENVSSYMSFRHTSMTEWEFLAQLCDLTDCGLLLDVNNVFVSANNHGFDARAFIAGIPRGRVGQLHLAGHSDQGTHLLDTHDHPVCDGVWALYRATLERFGPVSTLIEWDDHIPAFAELVAESERARAIGDEVKAVSPRRPVGTEQPSQASRGPTADKRANGLEGELRSGNNAPTLRELEQRLYHLIVAPEGVTAGLVELGLEADDLSREIVADVRLSAVERLDIYANMYFFRLEDILRDEYPKLAAVLGAAGFHDLMVEYLARFPSEHPSVARVGERLPGCLREHPLSAIRPYLVDLAALERARIDVFDRADAAPLSLGALRARPPETFAALRLPLVPAHAVFSVACAVEPLWRTIEDREAPPSKEGTPLDLEAPPRAPHQVLVWREGLYHVYHRALEPLEAEALAIAAAGAPFGRICDLVAERVPETDAGRVAFELLGRWVTDQLISEA